MRFRSAESVATRYPVAANYAAACCDTLVTKVDRVVQVSRRAEASSGPLLKFVGRLVWRVSLDLEAPVDVLDRRPIVDSESPAVVDLGGDDSRSARSSMPSHAASVAKVIA
jgi:hypothetical protein